MAVTMTVELMLCEARTNSNNDLPKPLTIEWE